MNVLLIPSLVRPVYQELWHGISLGLVSVASNLDSCHKVKILDPGWPGQTINARRVIDEFQPRVIGLSCMVHQYEGARNFAAQLRKHYPDILIVLGGYHATTEYREILDSQDKAFFDYIIRKEGEYAFNKLLQAIEGKCALSDVPNLSYLRNRVAVHNDSIESCDLNEIKLPDRRLVPNLYPVNSFLLGASLDNAFVETVETSRGCNHHCHFCSIKQMYSKPYRAYSLERVIQDLQNIKQFQPKATVIVFIDDNITADPKRLEALCDRIIERKLDTFKYFSQCSSIGLSSSEKLVAKMKTAGFHGVFVGIENNSKENLRYLGKGDIRSRTKTAFQYLNKHGITSMGNVMVGCPNDDKASIKSAFRYLRELECKIPSAAFITPLPKTVLREDYLKKGLIDNIDEFTYYNPLIPAIHTHHLTSTELYRIYYSEYLKIVVRRQAKALIKKEGLKGVLCLDLNTLAKFLAMTFVAYTGGFGFARLLEQKLLETKAKLKKATEAFQFFDNNNVWDRVKARQAIDETHGAVTIDLKPYINASLTDAPLCPKGNNNNNLAELPAGKNLYGGVPFQVDGSIQLMGRDLRRYRKKYPSKVKSIPIERQCKRIHLLHGAGMPNNGNLGSPVAKLVLHYQDRTTCELKIVAGQHVFAFWSRTLPGDPVSEMGGHGSELAWLGSNSFIRMCQHDAWLCLFRTSFENPRLGVTISSVDYVSTKTIACPFLVGLTIE